MEKQVLMEKSSREITEDEVRKRFCGEEFKSYVGEAIEETRSGGTNNFFNQLILLDIPQYFRKEFNSTKTLEEQKPIIDAADRVYEVYTTEGKIIPFLVKIENIDEFNKIFLNQEEWKNISKAITFNVILLSDLDGCYLEKKDNDLNQMVINGQISLFNKVNQIFIAKDGKSKKCRRLPEKHFSEIIKKSKSSDCCKSPYLLPIDIRNKLEQDGKFLFLLNHHEHLVTCLVCKDVTNPQKPVQVHIFDSLLLNSKKPIEIRNDSIIYDIFGRNVEIYYTFTPILQYFGECAFFSYATRITIENMIKDGVITNSEDAKKLTEIMRNIFTNNLEQTRALNYGFLNTEGNIHKMIEESNNMLSMLDNDLKTFSKLQDNLKKSKKLLEHIILKKQQLLQRKSQLLPSEELNAILEELSRLLIPDKIELPQALLQSPEATLLQKQHLESLPVKRIMVKKDIPLYTDKFLETVEEKLADGEQREENLKQDYATVQKTHTTLLESLKGKKNCKFTVVSMPW